MRHRSPSFWMNSCTKSLSSYNAYEHNYIIFANDEILFLFLFKHIHERIDPHAGRPDNGPGLFALLITVHNILLLLLLLCCTGANGFSGP